MLKARHTFDLHTESSCHRLMNDERRAAAAAPINWNMYHILNGKKNVGPPLTPALFTLMFNN